MLERLAENSRKAVMDGVYEVEGRHSKSDVNIIDAIRKSTHAPLITEIKFSSPSLGRIRDHEDPAHIAKSMADGGAVGLSVLTQPHLFGGNPEYFTEIRRAVRVPMLMKDIVIDKVQIDAAARIGADMILLIKSIFDKKFATGIEDFISYAHSKKLLVLLESHTKGEFLESTKTDADILGINNRNLDTLVIDLKTTEAILAGHRRDERVIISESGVESPQDIRFLRQCGADAFLVGSTIMKSKDIKGHVSRLVSAI